MQMTHTRKPAAALSVAAGVMMATGIAAGTTPKEFETFIAAEIGKWTKVTKAAGISVK